MHIQRPCLAHIVVPPHLAEQILARDGYARLADQLIQQAVLLERQPEVCAVVEYLVGVAVDAEAAGGRNVQVGDTQARPHPCHQLQN